MGVLQGQSIVSAWQKAGSKTPFNIEVFGGSSDDNNAHMVYAGGMSVLKPYIDNGKFVIRSKQVAFDKVATRNWDGATAQARMDNLLSAFYGKDHLDAVWTPNDALAIGVISSLKGVGYGSPQQAMPVVTGQDADVQNVKSIVRGDQTSTVFKDTRKLASITADMVDDALSGKPVPVNDTKSYNNGAKIVPTYLVKPILVDKGQLPVRTCHQRLLHAGTAQVRHLGVSVAGLPTKLPHRAGTLRERDQLEEFDHGYHSGDARNSEELWRSQSPD